MKEKATTGEMPIQQSTEQPIDQSTEQSTAKAIHRIEMESETPAILKVAAYARVSTDTELLLHSIAAQIS